AISPPVQRQIRFGQFIVEQIEFVLVEQIQIGVKRLFNFRIFGPIEFFGSLRSRIEQFGRITFGRILSFSEDC
uniref:hypothetical protein n=1 Tax=Deinococcus sp. TaxID=47478 RepID=UPI0025BA8D77